MTIRALTIVAVTLLGACGRTYVYDPSTLPTPSQPLAVMPGQHVSVVLAHDVMTGTTSSPPSFVVAADVAGLDGQVAVRAGTSVVMRVVDRSARGIGRPGRFEFETVGVYALDGRWVPLRGHVEIRGIRRRARAIGLTIGMSFLYFPLSLFHMAHRGTEAVAMRGLVIDAVVMP